MIGSTHIQYLLRITWVANNRSSDWERKYPWVKSDPPACEVPPSCELSSCARFTSGFDSLSLNPGQSNFQYPIFLQKAHWFFIYLKSTLVFDLPRSPLPFRLELLSLTINAYVDVLLEDSLSFLLNSWFTRAEETSLYLRDCLSLISVRMNVS